MQFEPARTVFTFTSPVAESLIELRPIRRKDDEALLLPGETHGNRRFTIQRKL
jgi:hypothetical protein